MQTRWSFSGGAAALAGLADCQALSAKLAREKGSEFVLLLGDIVQGDCDDVSTHRKMFDFFNRGAGHFRLDVAAAGVSMEFYPGAALASARIFRLA